MLPRPRNTPSQEDPATTGIDLQPYPALPETARRLEKPCLLLKRTSADRAAIWGGNGIAPPPTGPYRHWISVDSRFLANGKYGRQGVLSIYTNEEDCEGGVTVFLQDAVLDDTGAESLYAHPSVSLPPPDASPDLDNEAYNRHWQQNCPIFNPEGAVAGRRLGGALRARVIGLHTRECRAMGGSVGMAASDERHATYYLIHLPSYVLGRGQARR